MSGEGIRCVVGIDVAKRGHVVSAPEAPTGRWRRRPKPIAATAEGDARLRGRPGQWGTAEGLLIGVEATGSVWEPPYDARTRAGYRVVVLNPRQTASRATSPGLRAEADGIDAHTIARGLLAGYGRASTLPDETIRALRESTRARRDLVQSRAAARQRPWDESVAVFPGLGDHRVTLRLILGSPALLLRPSAG